MKPIIGVAGEDMMLAGYALGKFLKEAGNFEHHAVEFMDMKRWVDIFLYEYHPKDKGRIGVGFTIFRERWNGSLNNINLPLVYAVLEAPQRENEHIGLLWDITLRRIDPSVRCYNFVGNRRFPGELTSPLLMTEPR